jgi:outer membrane biosynthesis protein TonB
MSVEILNSAIMQLRGKAQEIYGIIKDIHRRPSQEGDADKIMTLSLKLAQIEGGLVTLEQYSPEIVRSVAAERAAQAAAEKAAPEPEEEPPEEKPPEEPKVVGHKELMEQSPTYRKSIEKEQLKSRAKKKKDKS